jgi:hypothetical protein
VPIVLYLWPGSAQPYNTRKGKTAGRLIAVFKYPAAPLNKGRIEQNYQEAKMTTKKVELPKPRCLTVGYHSYDTHGEYGWTGTRKVPMLRMSGEWLKKAGFVAGKRVRAHVAERCITILIDS